MNRRNYLVILDASRHGETASNLLPGFMGGREPELEMTPIGTQQINNLGDRYISSTVTPEIIYTSTIQRAVTSGHLLATKLGMDIADVRAISNLDEIDMGRWAGKLRSEVFIGDALVEMERLGKNFKGHGGESHNEVTKRVQDFLDLCIESAEEGSCPEPLHIAAITHFTTIKCMLNAIGVGGHKSLEARIYNGRTMRICYHRTTRQWELHGFNLTDLALGE